MIKTNKSSTHTLGTSTRLNFNITQHSRDAELIKGLVEYLGCGGYYSSSSLNSVEYRLSKNAEIIDKIIPFFDKYPLFGTKKLDFFDLKRAAVIVNNKDHLTAAGLKELLLIKAGMNRGRSN